MAMWRREEPEIPVRPQPSRPGHSVEDVVSSPKTVGREPNVRKTDRSGAMEDSNGIVGIGKSIVVKGELSGNEDLRVEGRVEGKIDLNQNLLTVGESGKVKAQIFAKTVVIIGEVLGNVTAVEKVSIQEKGVVDGDISSPRVAIAEGAHFRGSIDMRRSEKATQAAAAGAAGSAKPASAAGSARPSGTAGAGAGAAAAADGASTARARSSAKPEPPTATVAPVRKA